MATLPRKHHTPPVISQAEAGRIIGIAKQNVPGAIARGELRGITMPDGRLMVTRASALRAKRARSKKRAAQAAAASAAA